MPFSNTFDVNTLTQINVRSFACHYFPLLTLFYFFAPGLPVHNHRIVFFFFFCDLHQNQSVSLRG